MQQNEIGNIIALRRATLGLNQEDVAAMAGITSKTIYMIESGKGNPSWHTLQKIMEVLGLEIKIGIKQIQE